MTDGRGHASHVAEQLRQADEETLEAIDVDPEDDGDDEDDDDRETE